MTPKTSPKFLPKMSEWPSRCAAAAAAVVLAAFGLSLFDDPAHGGGPAYPTLSDYYQGPYGFFTHWSAVAAPGPDGKFPLGYAVCNVDPKQPLYFYWDTPGFGTGWNYPLELGTCATMTRSTIKPTVEDKALITFTQHNEKWNAKAYLPDEIAQLPQNWFSRLVGFFTMPGSDPRIVDVSVRVIADESKHVTCILTWYQGTPGLAVGFDLDGLPDSVQRQILANLESAGVNARFSKPSDFVAEADREHLPGRVAEANYLVMTPRPGAVAARFDYNAPTANPATQPLMITDGEKRVIAIGSYTSVR